MRFSSTFIAICVSLMVCIVAYAADPISIQSFFGNRPKVSQPIGGDTRIIATQGGAVKQLAYSSVRYTLPAATGSTLGGIKVGTGLAVDGNGVLSNTGIAGVASFNSRGGAVTPGFSDYSASMIKRLSTVAKSGSYADLTNKPTIPAAQVNSDWNASSGVAQILNKPTIPTSLSQLSGDSTHRTVTDVEKNTWNSSASSVPSVFGRTGNVTAQSGDYTAEMVGADALGSATSVQGNLDTHTGNISNPHSVTKTQVGLGNVDNTSDLNKPISTLTQSALDGKLGSSAQAVDTMSYKGNTAPSATSFSYLQGATSNIQTQIDSKLGETVFNNYTSVDRLTNSSSLSASNLNGTIDGDRLPSLSTTKKGGVPATGTPSGKYLKDDGTWAAVPSGAWGSITGTLSAQTDLNSALSAKANTSSLATVATSGSYNDLSNKPTLGTAAAQSSSAFVAADGAPKLSLSATSPTSPQEGQLWVDTSTPYSDVASDSAKLGGELPPYYLDAGNLTGTVPSARGGAGSVNGILKANGSGTVSAASTGTDYVGSSGVNKISSANTAPGSPTSGDVWLDTLKSTSPQRVLYLSDTHQSATNVVTSSRMQTAMAALTPNYVTWMGDFIDNTPSEWAYVKTDVNWIKSNYPRTEQHALMGNHDYLYYTSAVYANYDNDLPQEIETYLTAQASSGQAVLTVKSTDGFIVGHDVIVIQTPDNDSTNPYFISTVSSIDSGAKTITLAGNLTSTFSANSTAVRQGYNPNRGIGKFLDTFAGTATGATRHVFTVGNTAFIMLSLDNYINFRADGTIESISTEDREWFERTIAAYHLTHNVIAHIHIPPDSGTELGGLYDWGSPTLSNFAPEIKNFFRQISKNYKVPAWVAGHNHPDARTDTVSGQNTPVWGDTTFVLLPPLVGTEGQVVTLDLTEGSTTLDFKYWSTDTGLYFKTVSVPATYTITFTPEPVIKQSNGAVWSKGIERVTLPQSPSGITTGQNLGTGEGVFSKKLGLAYLFKTLKAGTNVTLSSDDDEITINSSGGGTASGSDGYVQFATTGAFNSDSGLTWNNTSKTLTATNLAGNGSLLTNISAGGWTNDGTQSYLVDSTDRVGIGTATPAQKLHILTDGAEAQMVLEGFGSSAATINFQQNNGTVASKTASASGNRTGSMFFKGYDGATQRACAAIFGEMDGEPNQGGAAATLGMPGRLMFFTVPSNSDTRVERMRIDSAGNVGIGTTSSSTNLHVNGGIAGGTTSVKTADYTLTSSDHVVTFNPPGTGVVATLPACTYGISYSIGNIAPYTLTISRSGSDALIGGGSSLTGITLTQFQTATVTCNGGPYWHVVKY